MSKRLKYLLLYCSRRRDNYTFRIMLHNGISLEVCFSSIHINCLRIGNFGDFGCELAKSSTETCTEKFTICNFRCEIENILKINNLTIIFKTKFQSDFHHSHEVGMLRKSHVMQLHWCSDLKFIDQSSPYKFKMQTLKPKETFPG